MMEIEEITVSNAKKYLDDGSACFIDIRDPDSYDSNHIEGALSLNGNNINDYMQKTDKRVMHIIYCYHGNSSVGAAEFFQENGFENVYSLAGGFAEWESHFDA